MLGLEFERKMERERNRVKDLADADCREFFCHLASDFYVEKMIGEFDRFEKELLREAIRYPFTNIVKIPVSSVNTYWSSNYPKQIKKENENMMLGSVFMSSSGWIRRNIYRIFKETEFKNVVIKRLGLSDRFFLSMSAEILHREKDDIVYRTTVWLNFKMV